MLVLRPLWAVAVECHLPTPAEHAWQGIGSLRCPLRSLVFHSPTPMELVLLGQSGQCLIQKGTHFLPVVWHHSVEWPPRKADHSGDLSSHHRHAPCMWACHLQPDAQPHTLPCSPILHFPFALECIRLHEHDVA